MGSKAPKGMSCVVCSLHVALEAAGGVASRAAACRTWLGQADALQGSYAGAVSWTFGGVASATEAVTRGVTNDQHAFTACPAARVPCRSIHAEDEGMGGALTRDEIKVRSVGLGQRTDLARSCSCAPMQHGTVRC